ncbi:hypothetical protein [Bradyrhizobium sp. Arg816]|uniref:hypothetical protein n=1 Tax=Bradyrhizobium sp. Arg816 TaxID=2998491 RepID=UPI00249F8CA0|nr:hypothetical protein [Bradyrhizobium sp. Arg816]MDI3566190.1 hypothetical protein [Bradyrhizobium sp. Arg816]
MFDTSGKTLAEWHHRKTFGSARADPQRAFLFLFGVTISLKTRFDTSGKTPAE